MAVTVGVFVPDAWNREKRAEIMSALRGVGAKHEATPMTGAGASGLAPELLLLLSATGGAVAAGFLGAVGKDLWAALKLGMRKIATIKPDRMPAVPPEMVDRVPRQGILIWELRFEGLRVLVLLPLDEGTIDAALDALPGVMDDLYTKKRQPKFLRLHWEVDSWKDYS